MTYAGLQTFMTKLKQLVNCNHDPVLVNNPEIICERPQFQVLYEELGSMIQTLFKDEHLDVHEIEKVNDLKKKLTYAAEEVEYIVDLFLSSVHIRNNGHFPISGDFKCSLDLDDARKSLKSVKVELTSTKMDSFERTVNQSDVAQIPITRNVQESTKLLDETVVGLDRDTRLIRDKLVEDQRKLDVVSIVGMGGIGKTTLATKVFNDSFIRHHFHVRVWVTVSQTYDRRGVLIQILASLGVKLELENASDSRLREMVHKHLMGRRYLIVIDDIWDIETWDNLKLFFSHDNRGSRILLTSRLTQVAKHANPYGFIHHLGHLNKEKSWELLCHKVFQGDECPEWSIKPGIQIVETCQGLPLAVVVIAGFLAKEAWSEEFWVEIADKTVSYIVGDENGSVMESLGLSYSHLPLHLKECFLYLGGFPVDYKFQVQRLIWLWIAEGFIQQEGDRSLEDIAKSYLMDLIDRNLVIIVERKSIGGVKACKVQNLVRELCLKKAKEERFILKIDLHSPLCKIITPPYKPCHMFISKETKIQQFALTRVQNLRSILCFGDFTLFSDDIANYFRTFVLLRVLDLQNCRLNDFSYGMELLVHLRYLAIWISFGGFPSSICKLWSLQTLIYITSDYRKVLPSNISDLVNLKHLWSYLPSTNEAIGNPSFKMPFFLPSIEKPMNLQTISNVVLGDRVHNFQMYFPCIKELTCRTQLNFDEECDFKSLNYLEKLKLTGVRRRMRSTLQDSPKAEPKNHITFPATLKTLKLVSCRLQWRDMSIIQSLPNLQVLKLRDNAFVGSCWNTDEQVFRQLKFLKLEGLDIKLWEAWSTSFPRLKKLEIFRCLDLEEIPLEIGDIPTLKLIQTKNCSHSVDESVRRIQEEQHGFGNYDLKIYISRFDHFAL